MKHEVESLLYGGSNIKWEDVIAGVISYKRLPLKGLGNARDLGGYPVSGGVSRFRVFVRSEVPAQLTREDIDFLRFYGIKTDIDIRGYDELELVPDVLRDESWIEYIHLPMFHEAASTGAIPKKIKRISESFTWGEQYKEMSRHHGAWLINVLETMANAQGTVIFHCTTGKDRTGLIAAAILGLCGASEEDIIADYCVSQVYLRSKYLKMAEFFPGGNSHADLNDPFFSTAPENMALLLSYFNDQYGGICEYLSACGMDEAVSLKLRKRFICDRES